MSSIWWIRRDVRLEDQPALWAAMERGPVIPLFILDPDLLRQTPGRRQAFLFDGLRDLDAGLRRRGARLVVRAGKPVDVLPQVMDEAEADAVFAEEDYTPYARRRDQAVGQALDLCLMPGLAVHPPNAVTKSDGSPYIIYSPYARAWKRLLPERLAVQPAPDHIEMPARAAFGGASRIRRR